MSTRNLDRIFKPRRIAVVGASHTSGSVGYTVLRNLLSSGFEGAVYPVNPKHESIQGVHAYARVAELPQPADLAVICTPAQTVPGIVRECGEAGIRGLVIVSAGFREIGGDGKALEEQVRAEADRFHRMRIIGPNCLGVIAPGLGLNASFAAAMPQTGHVAFVSQSGALCTSVLDWAMTEGIGFSHFVSVGNMLDVDFGDLIDYFGENGHTRSLIFYAETITDARKFMSAARAFARSKPIVAYKAGRFAESAKAAASHTGALAGEDAVYDAAFGRAGIERVSEIDDIFDCAELLARQRPPRGARLAIITNAGGPGVMAADALLARHGVLAELSHKTIESLNTQLPPFWSHGNPVDVLGDAPPERFKVAADAVLADPQVDAVLVILSPQAMTNPTQTAVAVGEAAQQTTKPLLAAWMGGRTVAEGIARLNRAGVPTYTTPEPAVRAFMHLVSYARNLETLYETPRELPVRFTLDRERIKDVFGPVLMDGRELLSEPVSKALLEAYEIPVTKTVTARSADSAVAAARRIGYPVVLKVFSPEITHKTDVGGVMLNLQTDEQVRGAYEQILATANERRPEARVDGVTVQKMLAPDNGFELIIGAKHEPTFGAVILAGMGGTAAEVFGDRSLGLPPLNERLARRMLESLRSWPLLQGYRGRPGVNLDRLIEVLMRFSYLVADYPEIKEIDVNPLLVTPENAVALDARVVLDRELVGQTLRPYAHLAIRPYPEQYVWDERLEDGTRLRLRPIRPEDEPRWHELLASCTPESIRSRFRYLFKHTTHEMATRFCFIDYDREMALVAEIDDGGDRKLAGVGRLVADANHEQAEFAVLVGDPWQGKGLGQMLTDYCLRVARSWDLRTVVAETDPDNRRMLATFRALGFELRSDEKEGVVYATKSVE